MLPRFLEDLLQSEDLVRGAATRIKNRTDHLSSFDSTISRLSVLGHLAYTFSGKLSRDIPL